MFPAIQIAGTYYVCRSRIQRLLHRHKVKYSGISIRENMTLITVLHLNLGEYALNMLRS